MTVLKGDGYVNDSTAGHASRVHCLLGVRNSGVFVKAGLDGLVERASLGGELILVLDEDESRLGGVELVDGHVKRRR